jgi:hypothetical protein
MLVELMVCPHCRTAFTPEWYSNPIGTDSDGTWRVRQTQCDHDECKKWIVQLGTIQQHNYGFKWVGDFQPVRPKAGARPVPRDVPDPYASDFTEAVVTLPDSPKASAALSRRCLQMLIREKAGIKGPTLNKEIDDLLASNQLPSWLADNVDAIRNVGNFAAHPMKDTNTGAIVDVEPGEAEWLLDVLEGLFDFYFVQPAKSKRKRDALNQKLRQAGKPALK